MVYMNHFYRILAPPQSPGSGRVIAKVTKLPLNKAVSLFPYNHPIPGYPDQDR